MSEKILLCRRRRRVPGRRQDGVTFYPPESLFDIENGPFEIQEECGVVCHGGKYYLKTEAFFPNRERVYALAHCIHLSCEAPTETRQ